MTEKFDGTIDELKACVDKTGYKGEWKDQGNKQQFRTEKGAILNFFKTGTLQFQGKNYSRFCEKLMHSIGTQSAGTQSTGTQGSTPSSSPAVNTNTAANKKIFVIHGHDSAAREQLELILMKLGLKSFILQNNDAGGKTLIGALEQNIYENSAIAIVLLTPDDFGYSQEGTNEDRQPRARQNVILEMGMAMARLGRDKTLIIKKGALEMPSDISGIQYHEFNQHVKEIVPKLVQRLNNLGFAIGSDEITAASS